MSFFVERQLFKRFFNTITRIKIMRHILLILAFSLCTLFGFSQNVQGITLTKEVICKGAAISVVGNVKPFVDRNFSKAQVLDLTKGLVKAPIKDAPAKAYDLLKARKTQEEVTATLYDDFMKLDNAVVSKFLINAEDSYEDEDDYEDNDDY